jgi:hypothetical protein
MFSTILFLTIGIFLLILFNISYSKFKKNKRTFLDYAPGQPPHFFFILFGILFIVMGLLKLFSLNS